MEGDRYAIPGSLVDTGWLEEHLDDNDVRVIEVDADVTAYERATLSCSATRM